MNQNPFGHDQITGPADEELVSRAVGGDKAALETLIKRHQNWIFNIALRMVGNPVDAQDVTQEVLIKILTKLSTLDNKNGFRTWAYRIVTNHVLNMKQRGWEKHHMTFSRYGQEIDDSPDLDLPDESTLPVDLQVVIDETFVHCMMGMLLCLDREKRLVFILGEVFGINDKTGSEITQLSHDNYRQKLSRARKHVYAFMQQKCGLVDAANACKCHNKVAFMMETGEIDPDRLRFNTRYFQKVKNVCETRNERLVDLLEGKGRQLFREHPFQESPDFVQALNDIIASQDFNDIFSMQ